MINGAIMDSDGQMTLSYIVQYRSQKLVDIQVLSLADSSYPVIEASSLDGCQKTQRQYRAISSNPRRYGISTVDHTTKLIEQQQQSYQLYDTQTRQQIKDLTESV